MDVFLAAIDIAWRQWVLPGGIVTRLPAPSAMFVRKPESLDRVPNRDACLRRPSGWLQHFAIRGASLWCMTTPKPVFPRCRARASAWT